MKCKIGIAFIFIGFIMTTFSICIEVAAAAPGALKMLAAADKKGAQEKAGDAWQKVVEAAKKEAKVVYYGSANMADSIRKMAAVMDRQYGIKVEFMGQRGQETREKLMAEYRSGKAVADLVNVGITSIVSIKRDGVLATLPSMPNQKYIPPFLLDHDNKYVALYGNTYGILINTNLVKPANEPKSWLDLTDPKWKGQLLADDPRASGGGNTFFALSYKKFGEEWHLKMAQQKVHFTRNFLENEKSCARGDFPVYYPMNMLNAYSNLKGTPVKVIMPAEGLAAVPVSAGIPQKAPHPYAALFVINWLLSEEGQRVLTQEGSPGIRGDIDLGIPKELTQYLIGRAKLMGIQDENMILTFDASGKAGEIYGK